MRKAPKARLITVGSVTGNDNTVGGGGVYPVADLRELEGLKAGAKEVSPHKNSHKQIRRAFLALIYWYIIAMFFGSSLQPVAMMDGYNFNGAKAYKDSKLAIMMFANMLHEKYHRGTGISFSSIYPGCIAESPLFREKVCNSFTIFAFLTSLYILKLTKFIYDCSKQRPWFRKYFPVFMKYITGGFVGEEEAGQRLYQVIVDPRCTRSGVYWSWNGGPRQGRWWMC